VFFFDLLYEERRTHHRILATRFATELCQFASPFCKQRARGMPGACSELKSWAMRIARRAGANQAKVALARKLAVIMLRMLRNNMPFNPAAKAAAV
jgi:hypothetical protein